MSLIKCPECHKRISDTAPQCIHCGYVCPDRNSITLGNALYRDRKYAIHELGVVSGENLIEWGDVTTVAYYKSGMMGEKRLGFNDSYEKTLSAGLAIESTVSEPVLISTAVGANVASVINDLPLPSVTGFLANRMSRLTGSGITHAERVKHLCSAIDHCASATLKSRMRRYLLDLQNKGLVEYPYYIVTGHRSLKKHPVRTLLGRDCMVTFSEFSIDLNDPSIDITNHGWVFSFQYQGEDIANLHTHADPELIDYMIDEIWMIRDKIKKSYKQPPMFFSDQATERYKLNHEH